MNIFPVDPLENAMQTLLQYRPDVLYGYASYLTILAKAVRERGLRGVHPRLIFSHSELLDEEARGFINSVFGTETFDTYGSVEFIRLAWECPEHAGYHMDSDVYVMEFMQDGDHVSPGEKGEILVSSLHGYAMPFIRYDIGDVGVPISDKCPCGRGLPLMGSVEGRADDFIILANGKMVSPRSVAVAVNEVIPMGVTQYRIIQETMNSIRIELVKEEPFPENTVAQLIKEVKKALDTGVHVRVEVVNHIPTGKRGKIRKVVSKVQTKFSY